jgi:hypothetical protein
MVEGFKKGDLIFLKNLPEDLIKGWGISNKIQRIHEVVNKKRITILINYQNTHPYTDVSIYYGEFIRATKISARFYGLTIKNK